MPDDGFRSMETTRLLSHDVDDEQEKRPSTSAMILALAVPALGALLIDPLLTLADTAFVGRYSETAALAGKLIELLWV
jgi:Na+-driven multidrug efflux pump